MRVNFLGTAAAEGMPAVFCNCEACTRARNEGGKNIRSRSQILVNDDLLIDFPMDTYHHSITNKIDLSKVENLLITHAHMDHCSPMDLAMHGKPYAHNMTNPTLNIYGNKKVCKHINTTLKNELKRNVKNSLNIETIMPYQEIKTAKYKIIPMPAEHTKKEDCFCYVISDGKKTFFQFNDSGILPDSVYEQMSTLNIKIDAIAFDCTYGYKEKGKGRHMGFFDALKEKARMKKLGLLNPNCKFIITHFSHNCGMLFDELVSCVASANFIVAYDGMVFEL